MQRHAARLIACLAFVVAVGLNVTAGGSERPEVVTEERLWLHSPGVAQRLALSFRDLVADAYWVRAIVYYGSERLSDRSTKTYALLYPLLDFSTSLDRRFHVAYSLGAIFLSEGYPGGPGRPDLALRLLEKGRSHEPDRWQFEHDIAFVHYWWLRDFKAAAQHFEQGARLPGAPPWLRTMAATTLAKGGDRASARQLWTTLVNENDLDWIKRAATYSLQQLRALDDLDALREVVRRYTAQTGRSPGEWHEVVRAGLLREEPVDPTGARYELHGGVVELSATSPLQPLPGLEAGR